ncbi:MAG: hypothetical protein Q4C66_07090 [Lachnospiraceae bacterium]|nr:hypothetical protein [Lachnospiraceae bacterium]
MLYTDSILFVQDRIRRAGEANLRRQKHMYAEKVDEVKEGGEEVESDFSLTPCSMKENKYTSFQELKKDIMPTIMVKFKNENVTIRQLENGVDRYIENHGEELLELTKEVLAIKISAFIKLKLHDKGYLDDKFFITADVQDTSLNMDRVSECI